MNTTQLKLCAPCLFGLEGIAAEELRRMGMADVHAETGRVFFSGGKEALIRANLRLSTGERILVELGRGRIETFDALFELVRSLPWESLIPREGRFPVTGHCLNSKLMSVPDCQRIIKKAVARRLGQRFGLEQLPETGPLYQIRFTLMRDEAVLYLDSTGPGLHKRGWRTKSNAAPLRETLAAAMVRLSRYQGRDVFYDPFCGSGTLAIEAALAALNRAPGLGRRFHAMDWPGFDRRLWEQAAEEARSLEYRGEYRIVASDLDPDCVALTRHNAQLAGVAQYIDCQMADACRFAPLTERGTVVTNPPYGERLLEKQQVEALYRRFGGVCRNLQGHGVYILSSHPQFEQLFGTPADKRRKLYNGMIRCDLFMYRPR